MLNNIDRNKKHIVMIVLNNVKQDSRVKREAFVLKEAGYAITIFGIKESPFDSTHYIYKNIDIFLIPLITKSILPKSNLGWFFKYFEFVCRAIFKFLTFKIDFIHAHNLDALIPGFIAGKLQKARIVYDSHELFTEMSGKKDDLINKSWAYTERLLLKKVDKVIAANESRANIMHQEYGAKEIPNVILNIPDMNSQFITNSPDRLILKISTEKLNKKKVVLYQGGISPQRNTKELIFSVKKWDENLILVLIGPVITPQYEIYIRSIIENENLGSRVFLLPPVKSELLLNYTRNAQIGVIIYDDSSRNNYYCAPNKLFEYASVKIPIAGCDFPEIKKIIKKYKIGELFDPNNPSSIADAVNKIFCSYKNYIHTDGFDLLFKSFNWETQKSKLIKLYTELELNSF
ncbi:MAG: glycosyltransferase [Candidatus Cloacimonadota bacterium]|nr:glycosyltransferase [Candidatus Cloacimonadota bacterium]